MTPRPVLPLVKPKRPMIMKLTLLGVAVSAAIMGAWALDTLLDASHKQPQHASEHIQPVAILPVTAQQKSAAQVVIPQAVEGTPATNTREEFSLAGKVALPRAKPLSAVIAINDSQPSLMYQASTNSFNNSAQQATNMDEGQLSLTQLQQLSQQYDQQLQQAYQQSNVMQNNDIAEIEPIILGANANQRGLKELEALKLQVNMAANEVDFKSVRQPKSHLDVNRDSNLANAFAAALKDVEYEQSANKDVTAAKLDPIPQAKPQGIPKYGDLPASVQLSVPEFNIVAHVYSSDPNNRWLNVDGKELQQGDMIQGKLTIIEIRPRDIILEINGQEFKVPAI
ncbi:general secretion pathway protein GspB [Shewanella sp. OMA3-2]|uniref:general secretion pathway protein GspB n=1 Tax=Shewanella sp. OMA3-2 TaxID=2908650 RepID=UPI001F470ED8|nr:general secretion pathway protein GspB [Shewanella sp. OMA3-2]UJF21488.1 general secretion pathway protein GspB [Shewanella sp. OMA3-2]